MEGKETENGYYQKLIELKQLLDQGVITQEEFNKEKKEILDLERSAPRSWM